MKSNINGAQVLYHVTVVITIPVQHPLFPSPPPTAVIWLSSIYTLVENKLINSTGPICNCLKTFHGTDFLWKEAGYLETQHATKWYSALPSYLPTIYQGNGLSYHFNKHSHNLKHWKHFFIFYGGFSRGISQMTCGLEQQSPTFLAPGTNFVEDNFSPDWGRGRWFQNDSSALNLLCTHLISDLMPPLIWWEVLVCDPDVGNPWSRL